MRTAPKRIVVAHVVLGLKVGGLERFVVNLTAGLIDRYRPVVICVQEGGEFQRQLEALDIPVYILARKRALDWNAIWKLVAICRAEGVQIVHTHNPAPHLYGTIATSLAKIPVSVHTKHGPNNPQSKKLVRMNRILSWQTDAVIPVSNDIREIVVKAEKVHPGKVHRIWNGIDPKTFYSSPTGSNGSLVIGNVARLDAQKDQSTLLTAFRDVLKELPKARLVLAGEGPLAAELKALASRLGIADRVDFLGNCTDIPALLRTFSLFTLSSAWEGLSLALLEAMAAGLPVVVTDVSDHREVVLPPRCGLLVPPGDPASLAKACLTLLRDPERRRQMGAAARARVVQDFSLERMLKEYATLYETLLARKLGHDHVGYQADLSEQRVESCQ